MPTYYLNNVNSDLSGGADFDKRAIDVAGTKKSIVVSIAAWATETSYAYTEAGVPYNADWETGTITVKVDLTAAQQFGRLKLSASRLNSSGVVQETSTEAAEQNLDTTGTKTFVIPSMDWSAGATGDRLRINYIFRNATSKGAISVTIQTDSSNATIVTVITQGSAGPLHPAPTSPEADRQTNPTNASENPIFSAIFNSGGGAAQVDRYEVEIAEDSGFVTSIWNPGYKVIPTVDDGNRCDEIKYDWDSTGIYLKRLPPAGKYYWRCRFKHDATSEESVWSATAELSGFIREWDDDGFACRELLNYKNDHQGIAADDTVSFTFKTGVREQIASNAKFDAGLHPVGYMIDEKNGKSHLVYLSNYQSDLNKLAIFVNSKDHQTGLWGTPHRVDEAYTASDTHNFGTMAIDTAGHIWLAYGCHTSQLKMRRTKTAGITGALPGDPSSGNWINPQNGLDEAMEPSGATNCTYPYLFITNDGRIYVMYRNAERTYQFHYSTDGGDTWSGPHTFIKDNYYDVGVDEYDRVYAQHALYDPVKNRLLVAISFTHNITEPGDGSQSNDMEMGIWFIFSDYGETDGSSGTTYGFNIFRWADDALAGYTVVDPVDYEKSATQGDDTYMSYLPANTAIHLSEDREASIFHGRLIIDRLGEPIVIWFERYRFRREPYGSDWHLVYDERKIMAAKWSNPIGGSGSWTDIDISDQVNLLQMTRHICLGWSVDLDGAIRLHVPVSGKTFWHCKPTADQDSSFVTPAHAGANYAEFNGSISVFDGNTHYADIAAGGEMGFSSNEQLPAEATVLGVEIEAIVRRKDGTGTDPTAVLYVDNGSTEYDAAGVSITWQLVNGHWPWEPGQIKKMWLLNPQTSAAWTIAQAQDFQFGIKNTVGTAVLRVGRFIRRVYYTLASNPDRQCSEIMELTSVDDGLTWTSREITRNSQLGNPPFSQKSRLTNNEWEIAYCVGNSIFYMAGDRLGLIRTDAEDVRLFYGGSEIHRIIDFANMVATQITMKVPEAVASGVEHGPKDLHLYFARKWQGDRPLSDPSSVLIYDENFDDYSEGDYINGKNGWTDSGGNSATIYKAPPNYHNKVFAGDGSLKNIGTTISRTLGTDLTGILVELAIWQESSFSGTVYAEVEDGAGKTFRVGIKSTGVAFYGYDATDVPISAVETPNANYFTFAMLITDAGCSAWARGELLVDLTTAPVLTDVDKLKLKGVTHTYFDFIRVSTRLRKLVQDTQTTIDDKDCYLNADHTSTLQTDDGYHSITIGFSRIHRVDVKVRAKEEISSSGTVDVHCWVSNVSPYDSGDIADDSTYQITGLSDVSWTEYTFSFTGLTEGPKAIKVDQYAKTSAADVFLEIMQIDIWYARPDAVIEFGSEEWNRGFITRMVITGAGVGSFTTRMEIDSKYAITQNRRTDAAVKAGMAFDRELPACSRMIGESDIRANVESGAILSFEVEVLGSSRIAIERALSTLTRTGVDLPVHKLRSISSSRLTIDAELEAAAHSVRVSSTEVEVLARSVEKRVADLRTLSFSNAPFAFNLGVLIESGMKAQFDRSSTVGSGIKIVQQIEAPVRSAQKAPVGGLSTLASSTFASESALRTLNSARQVRRYQSEVVAGSKHEIAYEVEIPVRSAQKAPIGGLKSIASSTIRVESDRRTLIKSAGQYLFEGMLRTLVQSSQKLNFDQRLLAESLAGITVETRTNLASGLDLGFSAAVLGESRSAVSHEAQVVAGAGIELIRAIRVPVRSLVDIPGMNLRTVAHSTAAIAAVFEQQVAVLSTFRFEQSTGMNAQARQAVELDLSSAGHSTIAVELERQVALESFVSVLISEQVSVESLAQLAFDLQVPVLTIGRYIGGMTIGPVSFYAGGIGAVVFTRPGLGDLLLTRPVLGDIVITKPKLGSLSVKKPGLGDPDFTGGR